MPLQPGDKFPENIKFSYVPYAQDTAEVTVCGIPIAYNASKEWANKKVILVAVPGAFTPSCQAKHLPGFMNKLDALKKAGVDDVIFIAYNDAWVMSAWGKANGIKDEILFMCDTNREFSEKYAWVQDERIARWAMLIDHGVVKYADVDSKGAVEKSAVDAVFAKL